MRFFLLLTLALWPISAVAQDTSRQIVVTATGTVSAEPDMAILRIGVSREARTAGEAMAAASEAGNGVLAQIEAAGIEPRDVQTASIGLYPVRDQAGSRPPQTRGYVASLDLSVRVRELPMIGELLDQVVSEGANTMNGLTFALADPGPVEAKARAAAVAEARAKAETLAEAAGVALGPVQTIQEGGSISIPGPLVRGAMMEAAVPIAEGEMDITVSVTVVYAIE